MDTCHHMSDSAYFSECLTIYTRKQYHESWPLHSKQYPCTRIVHIFPLFFSIHYIERERERERERESRNTIYNLLS